MFDNQKSWGGKDIFYTTIAGVSNGARGYMLKIRKEQMNTFKDHILHNFEDKMFMHLKSQFPDQTQQIGESQLREMIHDGIFRAQKYGVTLEPDVCRYLECMVLHGVDFDINPKTSWAGDILRDKGMSGREKMNRIDDYEMFTLGGI